MTLIWHVQLADSISVALVISKDSVNTNTKKIIQVNLILYKALFLSKFLRWLLWIKWFDKKLEVAAELLL